MAGIMHSGTKHVSHCRLDGVRFEDVSLANAAFDRVSFRKSVSRNVCFADAEWDTVDLSNLMITNALIDGLTINGHSITELIEQAEEAEQIKHVEQVEQT